MSTSLAGGEASPHYAHNHIAHTLPDAATLADGAEIAANRFCN
jgi:hypothetical protein